MSWICFFSISCLRELRFADCFHSPSLSSPRSYICFHFSACMTNSKEIPNCGRPKPAAPPPAFSWQKKSCLTFIGECFARQLGLGEIQWGNGGNLIGWAVQRTVKPLHKEGARTALELLQKHSRLLLFSSSIPKEECGTKVKKKENKKFQEVSGAPFTADLIEQMETTNVRNTVWCPFIWFPPENKKMQTLPRHVWSIKSINFQAPLLAGPHHCKLRHVHSHPF